MTINLPEDGRLYDQKSRKVIVNTLAFTGIVFLTLSAAFAWSYVVVSTPGVTEWTTSTYLQALSILLISNILMYSVKSET